MISRYSNLIIFCLTCLCIALGYFFYTDAVVDQSAISCPKKFNFISPDLNCIEDPQDQTTALEQSVRAVIHADTLVGEADRVSVFYRDLNNKQWFGVNENDSFAPGSLLKLPLAVAYYKSAEIEPTIMQQQQVYKIDPATGDLNDAQNVLPAHELVAGTSYSVHDLIEHMLEYSDNNAVPLLTNALNAAFLSKVYVDLGVYIPTSGGISQDFISVKTYGGILRTLYTSSYLNQTSSNELLQIMSQSSFRSGIAAGVPDGTVVANKFGERFTDYTGTDNIKDFELHDCGIVYAPASPYILCVMTKGNDFDKLTKVIADVSRSVWQNR